MHLPNIAEFDITHLSYSQMMRLSIEQPDAKLFIVPNSVNASTVPNIEKYDFENMSIFKTLWVGFNCMKRNRLYLVPRIYTDNDRPPSYCSKDRPPSYSAVVSSEEVRGSERGRSAILRQRRSSRALSIIQQLDACHLPIHSYCSSPNQRLAGRAPVTSFRSIDEDLEDLAGLCTNRASVVQIFFTGATGTIPPPVPHLADDLRRLAASLNTLRQALQRAVKGDCRASRFEILEDSEKVVIGVKKWVDKMKPMFEQFRVILFGNNDEFRLKVAPSNHIQWARKAREMETGSQVMTDKVFALRTSVGEGFEPWTDPATSTPLEEATSKDGAEASEPNWDMVQIARLGEVKRRREEEKRQLAAERHMAAWQRFAAVQEEQGAARQLRREVSTMATAGRVRSRSI